MFTRAENTVIDHLEFIAGGFDLNALNFCRKLYGTLIVIELMASVQCYNAIRNFYYLSIKW